MLQESCTNPPHEKFRKVKVQDLCKLFRSLAQLLHTEMVQGHSSTLHRMNVQDPCTILIESYKSCKTGLHCTLTVYNCERI